MTADDLSRLVRPDDVDTFFSETWARAARHYPQSLGAEAGGILDLESFELMLATLNRAHEGWLHLARGGLKHVPTNMVDEDGMLDLRKLRAAFAGGETLYLTKAERLWPALMKLCRAVELDLLARGVGLRKSVNAHIFLTPPGTQGFPPHRDEHASFVLQLEGYKEWTVYEPGVERTASNGVLRPGGVDPSSLRRLEAHTHRLHAGDVLYMPEWWPHEARAADSHSLHVTVRVFPLRWVDLLLELGADHPALAESVPRHATGAGDLLEPLVGVLGSREFREPLADLLADVSRRHAVPRTVLPADGLRQVLAVEHMHLDTPLERAAGASCMVFATGDEVCIGFPGGVIRGPAPLREVFEYVAGVTALRPRDLPLTAGVGCDRLDVARAMVRDGLLCIAHRDPAAGTRASAPHVPPRAVNISQEPGHD